MWTIEIEKAYVDLGFSQSTGESLSFTETYPVARKDDGTTIRAKSPWQGGADLFEYKDSNITFEFVANRFSDDRKLTDTYQLFDVPRTLSVAKAHEVVENIRAALVLMPPWLPRHQDRSPTKVNFNWKYWEETRLHSDSQGGVAGGAPLQWRDHAS